MVAIDRSLSKGEAPRCSAYFDRLLSCESPFKFLRHLVGSLEIDRIIAMSHIIFIAPYGKKMKKERVFRHGQGHEHGHGHGLMNYF